MTKNGKGDKPRPCDRDKYRENYDRIFRKTSAVGFTETNVIKDINAKQ